ncbi:uncharacterized protein LOC127011668 [Drosophila biarmipes]|uniref:uncharacterized protein LOC127011667 n=1 Tax=Drosophila biarmipes TaxID=125945 RepID=UPI0021CC9834|nr:uncharacterized protein LOC127011667 [Drosophila biarmipes]XP_050745632.1 uncharacterized protein LOC127011668 [Drosophila biarmipes]
MFIITDISIFLCPSIALSSSANRPPIEAPPSLLSGESAKLATSQGEFPFPFSNFAPILSATFLHFPPSFALSWLTRLHADFFVSGSGEDSEFASQRVAAMYAPFFTLSAALPPSPLISFAC